MRKLVYIVKVSHFRVLLPCKRFIVWLGKIGNAEIDFVVRDPEGYTKSIQVAQTVHHPETLARELKPFDKIPDHNERFLLTMDWETGSRNGVKQLNVVEWLLDGGKSGI